MVAKVQVSPTASAGLDAPSCSTVIAALTVNVPKMGKVAAAVKLVVRLVVLKVEHVLCQDHLELNIYK